MLAKYLDADTIAVAGLNWWEPSIVWCETTRVYRLYLGEPASRGDQVVVIEVVGRGQRRLREWYVALPDSQYITKAVEEVGGLSELVQKSERVEPERMCERLRELLALS